MKLDLQQVNNVLNNLHVLIIEDDKDLASRISRLIKEFTLQPLKIAHSMEMARKIVTVDQEGFELVIMDVMLPNTDQDFEDIRVFQKKLLLLRKEIKAANALPDEVAKQTTLAAVRDERAHVQKRIESLIISDAGIRLVEEWYAAGIQFPILFLTAVGGEDQMKRARAITGAHSSWVIKPVPNEEILEKCIELLQIR
jgi:DNA-binding response OmpR family regulator